MSEYFSDGYRVWRCVWENDIPHLQTLDGRRTSLMYGGKVYPSDEQGNPKGE